MTDIEVQQKEDDFMRILAEVAKLEKGKRNDYASQDDPFKAIRAVVESMDLPGYTITEDLTAMMYRKLHRFKNLRGKESVNESRVDTLHDLIAYAVLTVMALERGVK